MVATGCRSLPDDSAPARHFGPTARHRRAIWSIW